MSSDMTLNRLEKPQSLDEQAYEQIKEAIINCVFNPGDFLAEVRLAEELGISKTPIRKAMARLHQEGFLDNVPYRGYFVADISIEDIAIRPCAMPESPHSPCSPMLGTRNTLSSKAPLPVPRR